jgi:hypothetical protein
MKERPVLFSGEMVRAILDGRKTQTRRVVKAPKWSKPQHAGVDFPCPYGAVRDRLWVREKHSVYRHPTEPVVFYWADHPDDKALKWKPSIHMPRWASRITLEITDVQVETVQGISEDDAFAEGIRLPVSPDKKPLLMVTGSRPIREWTARAYFAELWDRINAKRGYGWDKNPWTWVIKFNRIKP